MSQQKLLPLLTALLLAVPAASASLLSYYTFDGSMNDSSSSGLNPTASAGVTLTTGYEGQAYDFTSGYIQFPLSINPANYPQFTMGAWVNFDTIGTRGMILSQDNGGFDRSIGLDTRGTSVGVSAFAGTGGVLGGVTVSTGVWTFVAASYDQTAGTVTLYVNGTSMLKSGNLGTGTTTVRAGMNPSFGEFFDGKIDNVFFFNTALTASEISSVRTGGAAYLGTLNAVPEPATAACWAGGLALLCASARKIRRSDNKRS